MATGPAVRIEGLAELSRALRRVDTELQKDLRRGLKKIADRVASAIRGRLPKGPTGRLSAGVRGRSTAKAASLTWPRNSVPYAGFIEFGNVTGRGGGVGPGDSHPRPFRAEGRFIFPYVADHEREIADEIEGLVWDLLRRADLT